MGHVTILFTKTGMLKASYANPQLFSFKLNIALIVASR